MYKQIRDKFLTEAMGECWHETTLHSEDSHQWYFCKHCQVSSKFENNNGTFSSWDGFGKLWNWSKTQEWWADFMSRDVDAVDFYESLIDPDHYADAIFELLSESV